MMVPLLRQCWIVLLRLLALTFPIMYKNVKLLYYHWSRVDNYAPISSTTYHIQFAAASLFS